MISRKRPRSERRSSSKNAGGIAAVSYYYYCLLNLAFCSNSKVALISLAEASSSFPGTLQPSGPGENNWWPPFESSSSSDWEWEDEEEEEDRLLLSNSDNPATLLFEEEEELFSDENNNNNTKTTSSAAATATTTTTTTKPNDDDDEIDTASTPSTSSNKPLQTLEKLQQMLDETDYLTTGSNSRQSSSTSTGSSSSSSNNSRYPDELWTSKDRSKYKRQQNRAHRAAPSKQQQQQQQQPTSKQQQQQATVASSYSSLPPQAAEPSSVIGEQGTPHHSYTQQQQQWYHSSSSPPPPPPIELLPSNSDVETTEMSETDGDGLGYTLPNLPVYLSDDEDEGMEHNPSPPITASRSSTATGTTTSDSATTTPLPPQQQPPETTAAEQSQQQQQQQQQAMMSQNPPPYYQHPPPPPLSALQQQQQQQQQWLAAYGYPYPPQHQQYYPWVPPPPPPPTSFYYPPRPYVSRLDPSSRRTPLHPSHYQLQQQQLYQQQRNAQILTSDPIPAGTDDMDPNAATSTTVEGTFSILQPPEQLQLQQQSCSVTTNNGNVLASCFKLLACITLATVVSYAAVSPVGSHPFTLYELNQKFYAVLKLVLWTSLPPLMVVWLAVVDVWKDSSSNNEMAAALVDEEPIRRRNRHKTNVSTLIGAFYNAFTWGYCLLFGLQICGTTLIRLAIFFKWERPVMDLTPEIPLLIVPWVLREHGYKPKRITLIMQDFVTSCILCPVVEEYLKLVLLKMTKLPKNFQWKQVRYSNTTNNRKKKKKRMVAEPILLDASTEPVINVNAYVSNMLAVTLGIKLADSIRRVCMYTKPQHSAKTFYAFFRGIFPVRELCGTATALALARRDVLGQHVPLWKLLLPACIFHGMANFRGMKPIFKWNSATPWVEMQLSPPTIDFSNTKGMELFGELFPKLLWLTILARVMGYCVKNYFMINRQAVKRTTTYAGKHSAFSAELAATEMLKSKKGENKG